jgi:hypothetical protein
MDLFKRVGLYPKKLIANARNPRALENAFARVSNASLAKFRDAEGSLRIHDSFGFGAGIVKLIRGGEARQG